MAAAGIVMVAVGALVPIAVSALMGSITSTGAIAAVAGAVASSTVAFSNATAAIPIIVFVTTLGFVHPACKNTAVLPCPTVPSLPTKHCASDNVHGADIFFPRDVNQTQRHTLPRGRLFTTSATN